jgi:hypothetical protein
MATSTSVAVVYRGIFQKKIDHIWSTNLIPGVTGYSVEDPKILNAK